MTRPALCLVERCAHAEDPAWDHAVPERRHPILAHLRPRTEAAA